MIAATGSWRPARLVSSLSRITAERSRADGLEGCSGNSSEKAGKGVRGHSGRTAKPARQRRRRALIGCVAAGLVGAVLAPTVTAQTATRTIRVKLIDYGVAPTVTRTSAGRVTFVVHNADGVPHNLVTLRTRRATRSLPVTGDHGRALELGRQGRTRVLGDEETVRMTLTLRRGRYLLICNVPGHYQRGMVVALHVAA
jgi:uncharacterized cupredoxin-like copper-binding protein